MRPSSVKKRKMYVDKLVALKSLALSLSNTSPEFLIDQTIFLPDLSINFLQCLITFLTALRHEVYNLKSYVVVQDLAL